MRSVGCGITSTPRSWRRWACPPQKVTRRPGSLDLQASGAIASLEDIHFYLMAYARCDSNPDGGVRGKGRTRSGITPRLTSGRRSKDIRALKTEYTRLNEFVQLARQTGGEEWNEPDPDRTLSAAEQRRMSIRYGVVIQPAAKKSAPEKQEEQDDAEA